MKNLLLCLVVWIVTWKTWSAEKQKVLNYYLVSNYYFQYTDQPYNDTNCVIKEKTERKEFTTLSEAKLEAERIGKDRKNWDVEIWLMKELKEF